MKKIIILLCLMAFALPSFSEEPSYLSQLKQDYTFYEVSKGVLETNAHDQVLNIELKLAVKYMGQKEAILLALTEFNSPNGFKVPSSTVAELAFNCENKAAKEGDMLILDDLGNIVHKINRGGVFEAESLAIQRLESYKDRLSLDAYHTSFNMIKQTYSVSERIACR